MMCFTQLDCLESRGAFSVEAYPPSSTQSTKPSTKMADDVRSTKRSRHHYQVERQFTTFVSIFGRGLVLENDNKITVWIVSPLN